MHDDRRKGAGTAGARSFDMDEKVVAREIRGPRDHLGWSFVGVNEMVIRRAAGDQGNQAQQEGWPPLPDAG